jgi:hypothetical protein
MLPNSEGLLSEFLRGDTAVIAELGDRVYTSLPAEPTYPCLRLTRVGGAVFIEGLYEFDRPLLQIDVFGGPKATAWRAAETAREAIGLRLPGRHDKGLVYGGPSLRLGSLRYLPDATFDPEKPRYQFDVELLTRA